MTLIDALIQVESQGNDDALGDRKLKDMAYGCLQIRQPCVDDVNRRFGTNFKAEQCFDRQLSIVIFQAYMAMYATKEKLKHEPTDEDRARIWNGGPTGWKKQSTVAYWNKVKKLL